MRVGFYIDGFNVYGAICDHIHNVRTSGMPAPNYLKWVDYQSLCQYLCKPIGKSIGSDLELSFVKYFSAYQTARRGHEMDARRIAQQSRHRDFAAALESMGVMVAMGKFKTRPRSKCRQCGQFISVCPCGCPIALKLEEKETDVRMGVEMVADSLLDRVDLVAVLTNDSDIVPALQTIRRECPSVKTVNVAFEPRIHSAEVLDNSDFRYHVRTRALALSLLPAKVITSNGKAVRRPAEYDPPTAPSQKG